MITVLFTAYRDTYGGEKGALVYANIQRQQRLQ